MCSTLFFLGEVEWCPKKSDKIRFLVHVCTIAELMKGKARSMRDKMKSKVYPREAP